MKFATAIRAGARYAVPLLCAFAVHATDEPAILTPPDNSTFNAFTQFAEVLKTLHNHYIDPDRINSTAQVTPALREFVRALDPDAELYAPGELQQPAADTVDFGAWFVLRNGYPTVVSPRDGTTAQRAGLLSGEQITAINDNPTTHLRLIEVERQLRGRPGDRCLLRVLDPGTGIREFVVRRVPPAPPAKPDVRFLAGGVGYIRLGDFTQDTPAQLAELLNAPPRQQPNGLILDLRNNPGGPLPVVYRTAQLFLPVGQDVYAIDSPGHSTKFVSKNKSAYAGPLAVLVNGGTANEAEVLAAALRDNHRAKLIGTPTCGLGRQFQLFPLPDGAQLALPVAYYATPAGEHFHGIGVKPDITVPLPRAAEHKLAAAGFGHFDSPRAQKETFALDRQLSKALELLTK